MQECNRNKVVSIIDRSCGTKRSKILARCECIQDKKKLTSSKSFLLSNLSKSSHGGGNKFSKSIDLVLFVISSTSIRSFPAQSSSQAEKYNSPNNCSIVIGYQQGWYNDKWFQHGQWCLGTTKLLCFLMRLHKVILTLEKKYFMIPLCASLLKHMFIFLKLPLEFRVAGCSIDEIWNITQLPWQPSSVIT